MRNRKTVPLLLMVVLHQVVQTHGKNDNQEGRRKDTTAPLNHGHISGGGGACGEWQL